MALEDANLGLGANSGLSNPTANPFLTGANNPYLQKNIDASIEDLVKGYNLAQVPAQNAAAVRSGSFGNSALGELAQQDQNILQKNIGNLTNTARLNDYSNQQQLYMQQQAANTAANQWNLGFDKSVFDTGFNQNQQNLQTGIGLLGTLAGYNQGDYNLATSAQNTPLNYWSQFANQANGFGQGYGTSTSTQGTTSNPALAAAGGAQLGSSWWNRNGGGSTPISAENQANFDSFGSSNGWWGTA